MKTLAQLVGVAASERISHIAVIYTVYVIKIYVIYTVSMLNDHAVVVTDICI